VVKISSGKEEPSISALCLCGMKIERASKLKVIASSEGRLKRLN
jgi:hypothetical protein